MIGIRAYCCSFCLYKRKKLIDNVYDIKSIPIIYCIMEGVKEYKIYPFIYSVYFLNVLKDYQEDLAYKFSLSSKECFWDAGENLEYQVCKFNDRK